METNHSATEARAQAERYLNTCAEYTDPYEREKLIRDWMKKEAMATQVVGDFRRRAGSPENASILDIGFGNGIYAVAFAKAGAKVSGLEVNDELLKIAQEWVLSANVSSDLRLYDGFQFPHADNSFDFAYSISVLEHVSDPHKTLMETGRVLKKGGKFYLAYPNRWTPRETHTGIYFLGYLPRRTAQFLLRWIWNRNTIEEINLHFLSYASMKRMLPGTGLSVVIESGGESMAKKILKRILGLFGIHHSAILGTVMVVLQKT